MDITTLLGLVAGGIVLVTLILMGGDLRMFYDIHAVIIIFGGSFAATLIRFPLSAILHGMPLGAKFAFTMSRLSARDLVDELARIAEIARKQGPVGLEKVEIDILQAGVVLLQQLFGVEANKGSVVLVHALHRHAIGSRPRGLRQHGPPLDMGLVQNSGPVHRAADNRLSRAAQDVADRLQPVVVTDHRLDPSAAQGMPLGRRDVEAERRDLELAGRRLAANSPAAHRKRDAGGKRRLEKAATIENTHDCLAGRTAPE